MILNIEGYYPLTKFNQEFREGVINTPNILAMHAQEKITESGDAHTLICIEVLDSLTKLDMYQLGFDLAQKTSILTKLE